MTDKTAPNEKAVELDTPILRGKTEITSVTVRKPQSGALRGTRLQALMDMDVNAMMVVLPRVTSPALTAQEINEMDPADLLSLSVEVVSFFVAEVGAVSFPDGLTVEDLVADIATVFHWPPPVMYAESLTDVLEWRHKAIQRSGAGDDE